MCLASLLVATSLRISQLTMAHRTRLGETFVKSMGEGGDGYAVMTWEFVIKSTVLPHDHHEVRDRKVRHYALRF